MRKHRAFTGSARFTHFEVQARGAQPIERRRSKFAATSAAGCRIHDREIALVHTTTIAPRSSPVPICSASTARLIFIEAVRGKS